MLIYNLLAKEDFLLSQLLLKSHRQRLKVRLEEESLDKGLYSVPKHAIIQGRRIRQSRA